MATVTAADTGADSETCAACSLAAGEALAGTATVASSWLLVEVRGAWGRDAVADTDLGDSVRSALAAFPGKVLLIRRPDRRRGVSIIRATAAESGGTLIRQEIGSLEDIPGTDFESGDVVDGPIFLVCGHGRRDPCCARLGLPLFDALNAELAPDQLWQSSHLGGHRFAPNVMVLPHGVQLGRIPVQRASEIVGSLTAGRIPIDLYRGRTIYEPPVQAAEIAVRSIVGLDRIDDLRLIAHDGEVVTFATPAGELVVRVEQRLGPLVPASCGTDPEPTVDWFASLESAA
jgi:hypothetical protein